ncbi:aminotransferase class III-fold pyridoxal phosphate-dependent enzyme [Microvirga lotononidis]|uniref:ABC-type sugar transport system, periplasmic component n=1 Tax=Microvirga lotononidis TaxID=864069 RepID=I4YZK6_9HYPH|nr:aminotransferase class III-fold pyridoxal phosphate-dependent enzyme [Microvirga lotononidis]EIM29398.1 hypothetical protein MicloDRAFT_00018720 [Microvirga lotononidis]WQO27279.1 aminotransferase class III-fold pyridoxal phosphate-dependent enzyme [Microvirga lotononidis]
MSNTLWIRLGQVALAGAMMVSLAATASAGEVVIYNAPDSVNSALVAAFKAKHPNIDVKFVSGSTGPIAERAIAEKSKGERVIARVAEIGARLPVIRRARGKGALLAIEFDPARCGRKPGPDFAHEIVSCALEEGLSTTAKDAVSFGFSPPLTISDEELDDALARVEGIALKVASRHT